jgi:hypothetical protein
MKFSSKRYGVHGLFFQNETGKQIGIRKRSFATLKMTGGAVYPIQVSLSIIQISETADWLLQGSSADIQLGFRVETAGDVNGDGYADVLIGAPEYNGALTNEGKASLHYGNGGRGVSLRPRQRKAYNMPLAHLGCSAETTKITLEMLSQWTFGATPFAMLRKNVAPEHTRSESIY